MPMLHRHIVLAGAIVMLGVSAVVVWTPLLRSGGAQELTVNFLDVGQGDAILIETPSGRHMLIDGGVDATILRELGSVLSFFDRTIDIVVATHPDADHVGGLRSVLERYDVAVLMRPGALYEDDSAFASVLAIATQQNVNEVIARRGQVIDFGDGTRLEILFPDRDVSGVASNDASIVARVVFGEHEFLLTGDSPQKIEEYLVTLGPDALASDVLKVGHHGSKTSSSELFLGYVNPTYGVFSRGCDNRYGHPHAEVVSTFAKFEVRTFDTCTDNRIVFASDGQTLHVQSPR